MIITKRGQQNQIFLYHRLIKRSLLSKNIYLYKIIETVRDN